MSEVSKMKIVFEVDNSKLFDRIAEVGDGGVAIGARIAGILLAGRASFAECLGLAIYGITISEPLTETQSNDQ